MNDVYMEEEEEGYEDESYGHENMEKDHEMVFQQLSNLKANICALMSACSHGSKQITEAWVQSKVTLANDYIDTVHSYVVNGGHDKYSGQGGQEGVAFVVAVEKAMSPNVSRKPQSHY